MTHEKLTRDDCHRRDLSQVILELLAHHRWNVKQLAPLTTVALGLDNRGVEAGQQRAVSRNVNETVRTADAYLRGLSGKPGYDFLHHRAVDPPRIDRCADRLLARNR